MVGHAAENFEPVLWRGVIVSSPRRRAPIEIAWRKKLATASFKEDVRGQRTTIEISLIKEGRKVGRGSGVAVVVGELGHCGSYPDS